MKLFIDCLSDVYVDSSAVSGFGRGVFASRFFSAGEIISVSPILILPKHLLNLPESNTVLLNYVVSDISSDVSLFAMGKMTMSNHAGESSNTEIVWFDWETNSVVPQPSIIDECSIDELEASSYSKLDFAYRATRDINKGEELTVNYGAEWERNWENHFKTPSDKPFRHPIGAPDGLFPAKWKGVKCFGKHCKVYAHHKFMEMSREKGMIGGKADF